MVRATSVLCREGVPISEGPLSEVPLYIVLNCFLSLAALLKTRTPNSNWKLASQPSLCNSLYGCTVEPPNNGHVGDEHFVHCSEVVPSSEVEMYGHRGRGGGKQFVHCREVVHSSECPLYQRLHCI